MVNDSNILQNVILECKLTAVNKSSAFGIAYDLVGESLEFNRAISDRARYSVYSTESGTYVCDLEDRIEVNFANGLSKNIRIME